VQLRTALRLRAAPRSLQFQNASDFFRRTHLEVNAVTFHQTIHGRSYVIVVHPVVPGRWRAEVSRTPGATTALMPFYGRTPDEAAQQLAGWLERAGSRRPRPIGV